MLRSTRAALAVGLGCVGVAGLVGQSVGQQQDGKVRQVASAAPNPGTAPAPAAMPAVSIGTINVEEVFKSYDKVKVQGETLNAEAMLRFNSLNKLAEEGKQAQKELERFAPGSPDAKKIENRMVELKAQIEAGKSNAQREFAQKETETMTGIYNEIAEMAAGVARQRGMTFIVKYNEGKIQGSDPDSAMAQMSKTIVYADPRVDVTAETIKFLNYRYKIAGGPAPKTPNGPAPAPAAAPGATGRPATPGGR